MNGEPTLRGLLAYCAAKHKLQVHDLKGPDRFGHFVEARREFYWRARHATSHDWLTIAIECGKADHTTAMHGAGVYERQERKRLATAAARRREGATA